MNDDELKKLLEPARQIQPSDLQIKSWQKAVQRELSSSDNNVQLSKSSWYLQLAAAAIAGVLIGGVLLKLYIASTANYNLEQQISYHDATFEHSHANLD